MNAALSLEASAEALLICGDETSAAMCRRMAREARSADDLMGIGNALYRHTASQMAERASLKLAAFNLERREA